MRTMRRSLLLLAVLCASGATALANGYKILCTKSAKATGMGEAFVVQADDPTAVAYNPAGLAQLRGNQVNVQATVCNAYTERTSPTGQESSSDDTWQLVPSLFLTTDMGRDDMAVGLGIFMPNGLSSEWPANSFARYVSTYSKLSVVDICPAPSVIAGVIAALRILRHEPELRRTLWENIRYFHEGLKKIGFTVCPDPPESAVLTVPIGADSVIRPMSRDIYEQGVLLSCVVYPAVAPNEARLRFSVSAAHTREDLDRVLEVLERAGARQGMTRGHEA